MNRAGIADHVAARLGDFEESLAQEWRAREPIKYFVVDDLLPPEMAAKIRKAFPQPDAMTIKSSLRELKYIAAQMNEYDPILEEALYAFQDPRVVELVARITGLKQLEPDPELYAGGISTMVKGHFLNPHLDNSHDRQRGRYRVLNLLYYVSPDWALEKGGNLELWPQGPRSGQITIESRFNRLAVMLTNRRSWHGVSRVTADDSRCCVSNYYFSARAPESEDYFHVTSFRGRPEQRVRDFVLKADAALRMGIRKIFPKGAVKNRHFYGK